MPPSWSSGTPVAPLHRPRGKLVEETRAQLALRLECVVASESLAINAEPEAGRTARGVESVA